MDALLTLTKKQKIVSIVNANTPANSEYTIFTVPAGKRFLVSTACGSVRSTSNCLMSIDFMDLSSSIYYPLFAVGPNTYGETSLTFGIPIVIDGGATGCRISVSYPVATHASFVIITGALI